MGIEIGEWTIKQGTDPAAWPSSVGIVLFAYITAGLIGLIAYHIDALSASGAVAALLVGGTIFGFGGPDRATILFLFFALSSTLSFFGRHTKRKQVASELFEKGGKRDAAQVFANGGIAALAALLPFLSDSMTLNGVLLGAFCGSLAAATADTWATEIGVLSPWRPRLVTNLRAVEPGTSGGITILGMGASLLGALTIGAGAVLLGLRHTLPGMSPDIAGTRFDGTALLGASIVGGIAGALADSFLGATVQASYRCPQCDKPTESSVHKCGTRAMLVRGLPAVNNDLVNAGATAVGALVGGAVWWVLYT